MGIVLKINNGISIFKDTKNFLQQFGCLFIQEEAKSLSYGQNDRFSFFLFSCIGSPPKTPDENKLEKQSYSLPVQIMNYLEQQKDKFKLIDEKELNLLQDFIKPDASATVVYGDFNNNEQKDVALILRYTGYQSTGYKKYVFPFWVIFNDYEREIEPQIIFKTGNYRDEDIKTVIYEQFEDGIFSYIQKGNLCEKDVVEIIIPEKSTFYLMWNDQKQ